MADDEVAQTIADEVEAAGGEEVEVSEFPAEAQKVVKDLLKLED